MTRQRPRLLDLFSCQGGAGYGYWLAGFHVTGVDIRPQPLHPCHDGMEFVHSDAFAYLAEHAHEFDAVHASPPCRAYTKAKGGVAANYRHPDLVEDVRSALRETGLPYVIENVPGAPLVDPVTLCGAMFGLRTYRHRLFELGGWGIGLEAPEHPVHVARVAKMGRRAKEGEFLSVVGNFAGIEEARNVMEMPWANGDGLRQGIPPRYTEWVGMRLMSEIAISLPDPQIL